MGDVYKQEKEERWGGVHQGTYTKQDKENLEWGLQKSGMGMYGNKKKKKVEGGSY